MKPYLNEREAADFACCSPSHFRKQWVPIVKSCMIVGKVVYMTSEIQSVMDKAWQLSSGEEKTKTSVISLTKAKDAQLGNWITSQLGEGSKPFGNI